MLFVSYITQQKDKNLSVFNFRQVFHLAYENWAKKLDTNCGFSLLYVIDFGVFKDKNRFLENRFLITTRWVRVISTEIMLSKKSMKVKYIKDDRWLKEIEVFLTQDSKVQILEFESRLNYEIANLFKKSAIE